MFTWQCPLCDDQFGRVEADTEFGLEAKTANHITTQHEDSAAQRAVDRARLGCTDVNCSLGKSKIWDKYENMSVYKLTDFDKKFLDGIKVGYE